MDAEELDRLLAQLRRFRMDHQHVEVKRARSELPKDLWATMSAFANSSGGLILLGVDEKNQFAMSGVEVPDRIANELQSLATQSLEPPLRVTIDLVEHPDGIVVAAHVPAIPRDQRPCFYRPKGVVGGSFIRVGDGDHALTEHEVRELQAAQRREDNSARSAPPGARLDHSLVREFCKQVRDISPDRYATAEETAILRDWRAIGDDGSITLAGLLALGENPQAISPAARLSYRLLPEPDAPLGSRYAATHIEGTIGTILDDTLDRLRRGLRTYQVEAQGGLVDDTDVPGEALREILSNALVHRSLAPTAETQPVLVEVSDEAVRIVSPGGLHASVDPERLGLVAFPGVRNLALVRICEKLLTPSRRRIIEAQGSGVRAADIACRHRGVAPAIFVDYPDHFEVILLRGRLPDASAQKVLQDRGLSEDATRIRLIAWAGRFEQFRHGVGPLRRQAGELDVHFAARLCTLPVEDVTSALTQLQAVGILTRISREARTYWLLNTQPIHGRTGEPYVWEESGPADSGAKRNRVGDVVAALAAEGGEAKSEKVGEHLGLSSKRSILKWLRKAEEKGLVEPTTESPFDPGRAYRLTAQGRALWESLQRRAAK